LLKCPQSTASGRSRCGLFMAARSTSSTGRGGPGQDGWHQLAAI
jgi:hypothetical protein